MRLKLINWLEETIRHREPARAKMGRATLYEEGPAPSNLSMDVRQVVDYRLHVGARCRVDPGQTAQTRYRVFEMLSRELFGELSEELYRLEEWAFLEGYDKELVTRINRIRRLSLGEEVDG